MAEFVKKMNVKAVKTQYGEILKLGIHKDLFKENNVEGDWFNVDILRSKEGNKPYLAVNDYKPEVTNPQGLSPEIPDEIPY